jgi:MFS family permease
MSGLTLNYITPFALALKATTVQIGYLTSFPALTTAVSQLAAPNLTEKIGSRKGLILPSVFLHALLWIPVMLLPFIIHSYQVWWLIALITLSAIFGSVANPSWGSMMADLVPMHLRGKYFGLRGQITGIISLIFGLVGGGILELFKGNVFAGFALLFGGAAVFRFLSFYYLTGMYEPPFSREREERRSLLDVAKSVFSSNIGKFTLYVTLINLTVNIAGPFFSVYMLRDLGFSYTAYVINSSAFSVAFLLFQTWWGRRADKAWNVRIIRVTSFLLPLVPVFWIFSPNIYFLIFAQVFSGFAWAGFNLTSGNFVYDCTEQDSRTNYIAFFNALTGLGNCLGALAGGYLAGYLPAIFGNQLRTLFVLSGVLRLAVVLMLLRLILEVRHVPKVNMFRLLLWGKE